MFCMTEKFSGLYSSLSVRPSLVGFKSEVFQSNSDINLPICNDLSAMPDIKFNGPSPLVFDVGTKETPLSNKDPLSHTTSSSNSVVISGVVFKSSRLLAAPSSKVIGLYLGSSGLSSTKGINIFLSLKGQE